MTSTVHDVEGPSPVKAYFIQLYGFLIKTWKQRWRSPLGTVCTVLVPCLFAVLLSLCFWLTPDTLVPTTWYGEGTTETNTTMNVTTIVQYSFCRHNDSQYAINWDPCMLDDAQLFCLPNVGTGKDVCLPTAKKAMISGLLYSMYYGSGAFTLNPMDAHLTLSAYARLEREASDPTYFGRGGRESITHFGKLLVASDSADVADKFMTFCREESGMCHAVLHNTAFSSFSDAEDYALSHSDEVWAVVYLPSALFSSEDDEVAFTISMNYTATPWTFKGKVENLFSKPATGSEGYVLYWTSGFMTLQTFVQQFVLQTQLTENADLVVGPATYESFVPVMALSEYVNQWGYAVVPMPTPETNQNGFLSAWGYYLPLICALAALFPVAHLTTMIVEEKPSGIRETMLIMGMHHTCMFSGWYLSALVLDLIAALLVSMIFKLGFLSQVSYGVLFVVYFSFLQQNTALSLLISSIFNNPRIASWCAALTIFVFAMPYYTFPPGMKDSAKWGASTVPCVGFSNAIGMLIDYVTFEARVDWRMARQGEFSVVYALAMMWTSFTVMMVLALYLDKVWPGAVGRREHPLFFLRYFACCKKASETASPIALYKDDDVEEIASADPEETDKAVPVPEDETHLLGSGARPAGAELIEHYDEVVDPQDENIPVIFKDVNMVYITGSLLGFLYTFFTGFFRKGDYCLALRKVSFALHRGEVTTLLGPNGSGKTTIMNLATSMRTPTSGKVYIAGHEASENLSACRRQIGYCPQENIVWDDLTVSEHLTFYARMKGATNSVNVSEVVENTLELTGLMHNANEKAGDLSGGEKRRLCVGIALVGHPSVLFMDEPTAGLDVKGRREVYNVIQRARINHSVLISTHLLDEADRLGDRMLILNNGELCGEGSSMFLKSKTNVGYKLTCVMAAGMAHDEEAAAVNGLIEYVREEGSHDMYQHRHEDEDMIQAVPPGCPLLGLERRGREITFMFPLSFLASGSGKALVGKLDEHRETLRLRSVGISLTTLEDVFKTTTMRQLGLSAVPEAEGGAAVARCPMAAVMGEEMVTNEEEDDDANLHKAKVVMQPYDTSDSTDAAAAYREQSCCTFFRDFNAFFLKRLHYAKRDGKLVFFQVVLPMLFLTVALLINLAQSPMQPAITLDMSMYSGYESNPSNVMVGRSASLPDAFHLSDNIPNRAYGQYYKGEIIPPTAGSMNALHQLNTELSAQIYHHEAPRYVAMGLNGLVFQSGPPVMTNLVLHNSTYSHAAPQAIDTMYHLAYYQLFGDNKVPRPVTRNSPMYLGKYEKMLVDTNKQVMMGMFVILPFVLIPAYTISYIVREKEVGARHLQWLTGASMAAYWLSSFLFDALCYLGTMILAYLVFFAFGRVEYTGHRMIGPSICLFLLFGISSIPVSYVLSFFFTSPFKAQNTVLIINFVFGFLWVTLESLLADSAFHVVVWVTRFLRVLPSVSFGEGLYVLAGTNLGWLMYPDTEKNSLFALLQFTQGANSVFTGGVGTGLIYMAAAFVVSSVLLIVLEYLRLQRCAVNFSCCRCIDKKKSADTDAPDVVVRDPSVFEEEERVCVGDAGPETDGIVVQHLRKHYVFTPRAAVDDVSFGVRTGEVVALLGLNGAGKTTTLSILCGERVATSGRVFMNHRSISSNDSRPFIGYCPQFDALLDNLTAEEHLYLYARLRGMRSECLAREVDHLIRKLGLYTHRHQTAAALSGGNRRRLSLGLALVGNTTSVLLDEPTAGMDAFARSQTCAVIKALTKNKSVILTTHLFDETEALADRVAILSRGELQTIGTAQELKTRYSNENYGVYMMRVHFPGTVELNDGLLETLQRFIQSSITATQSLNMSSIAVEPTAEVAGESGSSSPALGGPSVMIDEVMGSGVKLVLRHCEMDEICDVITALNENRADGIPPVAYVSVSQPTMEDVLLAA